MEGHLSMTQIVQADISKSLCSSVTFKDDN